MIEMIRSQDYSKKEMEGLIDEIIYSIFGDLEKRNK